VEISLLPSSQADGFLATKPSSTFSEAMKKVLEGFVKNGGITEYKKDIIQTNNLLKNDKIQRNNLVISDKIQGNNFAVF
jgi:hypothetical protein